MKVEKILDYETDTGFDMQHLSTLSVWFRVPVTSEKLFYLKKDIQ